MTKRPLSNGGYAISPNDDEYNEFNKVWNLNAIAHNAHMHELGFSHNVEFNEQEVQGALNERMECMLDGVQEIWFKAVEGEYAADVIDDSTGLRVDLGES